MSKVKGEYHVSTEEVQEAIDMLGKGYDAPLEIHPETTVIRRQGRDMTEEVVPAFVKISTSFKKELPAIDANALKVWLFIALSINRNTGQAFPGVRTIAEGCGLSPNTVTAAAKRLEELGLLTVNREDRKYNIYAIPDYVSANAKSVANFATPPTDGVSVAIDKETVAIQPKTVATALRLNQINQSQPDNTYTEKPNFQNFTVQEAMGIKELQTFQSATGYFPGSPLWETIYNDIRANGWTVDQLKAPWVEWCKRGYNTKSLAWMEWIGKPIPVRVTYEKKQSNRPKSGYEQMVEIVRNDKECQEHGITV